jgi:putative RecB family exonuclease
MDLINANWNPVGFESARHNEDAKIKANSYVQSYLKNHDFKSAKISHSEEAFVFPVSADLSIEGKIDRVDDLGNGKIRIVDYKTGEHLPSDKDVARDLQLSIYALAANKLWDIKPENIELALYYFAGDKLFLSTRTQEQLDQAVQEILTVRDQILVSDFMCSKAHFCQKCDYSFLCSYGE